MFSGHDRAKSSLCSATRPVQGNDPVYEYAITHATVQETRRHGYVQARLYVYTIRQLGAPSDVSRNADLVGHPTRWIGSVVYATTMESLEFR